MEDQAVAARELNDLGVVAAQQRRLKEAADLFRHAAAADPSFVMAHKNLGNALSELGDDAGAAASFQRVLELDPRAVDALNNLGILRSKQRDYAGAVEVLQRAIQLEPNYAPAYSNLGIALAATYRAGQAVAAFRRAVALKPDYTEGHNNLGLALVESGRPDEALAHLRRALTQKPGYADAHRNLGIALTDVGQLDEALVEFQRALELDPAEHDAVCMNRARTLFLKGDYEAGWEDYEFRFDEDENIRVPHDAPRWDGAPLAGRTLLLEAEQGMGDTIQFVRFAAEIKRRHDARIILAVEKALVPLLTGVAGVDEILPRNERRPAFDVWLPLLSVPGLLKHDPRKSPAEVPYLRAGPQRVESWRERLAHLKGIKIGIAWQGNRFNKVDHRRSFPLRQLAPLGKVHGVTLVSLQKGDGKEQLDSLADFDVVSLGDDFDAGGGAFLDTAAVMKNLDLVISADTSVAHLAGALAVPVWVPLAFVPDWRWGMQGESTPWYPTMRLFRQEKLRDWPGVFERMVETLLAEFPAMRRKRPEEFQLGTSGFNRLARTRHGPLVYNRHDVYIGKSLAELGEFSENEIELFRQCVRPGATVVEAGANMGVHTVALARLVGESGMVHAIEPQRIVFQTLCANVALNSLTNVRCHHAAVGDKVGSILVPLLDFNQPNNFGGLALGGYEEGERVPLITIDSLRLARCDFLKIDVEGMELAALRGAEETIRRFRPLIYTENDRQDKSSVLIEALFALGYRLYWHVPRYYSPANYYGNPQNIFGNLSSLNMFGVHSSMRTDIQGLAPITSPQSDWRQPAEVS
jgi:FkbM family methyltransferase